MKGHANIPIFVPHLGCPHACSFCDQKQITSACGDVSGDDIKQIVDRALTTIRKGTAVQAAFFGGSFTAVGREKAEELLSAVQDYIKRGEVESIRISTRPDAITREILGLLKKYRVASVELGVQSSDDGVLKANNRGHTFADAKKATALLKEYEFETCLQMMIGLFRDTVEKSVKTALDLAALAPDAARIYPVAVLRGTGLCRLYESGEFVPLSEEETLFAAKEAVKIFRSSGVRVLRVGLMSSEGLGREKIAAGFYHPSFGEIVESELYFDRIAERLQNGAPKKLLIFVSPCELSKAIGNQKRNVKRIRERFGCEVWFAPSPEIEPGCIELRGNFDS